MTEISTTFSWADNDGAVKVDITYFDPVSDTYPTLGLSYMLYANTVDWTIFEDYIADNGSYLAATTN